MRNEEHEVQKAICNYLDIRRMCYFAVPNGGKRNKIEAKKCRHRRLERGSVRLDSSHLPPHRSRPPSTSGRRPTSNPPQGDAEQSQSYPPSPTGRWDPPP